MEMQAIVKEKVLSNKFLVLFSLSSPLASLVFSPVVAVGPLVRPASTESTETHPALTLLHTSRLGGRIVGYQP